MSWYLKALKQYADFDGYASRKEFWMFALFNFFIYIILALAAKLVGIFGVILFLYTLAVFIPSMAVSVRRLNDIARSGWWLLIVFVPIVGIIVLLVFMAQKSKFDQNPDKEYRQAAITENQEKSISQQKKNHLQQATRSHTIPDISDQQTSFSLVDSSRLEPCTEPGSDAFQDAIRDMNNRNDKAAISSWRKAIAKGLDPLRRGYAHANLGELYFRAGDLNRGLKAFFSVLNTEQALYDSAHAAALYLLPLYKELGRPESVMRLEKLIYKTSAIIDTSLSGTAADNIRQLIKQKGGSKCNANHVDVR